MKFYLDENLSPRITERLRQKGIDAISAYDVGNLRWADRGHLVYAAREGRCLVTKDVRHFVLLSKDALARQEPHAGIILIPATLAGFEISHIVAAVVRVARRFPKGLGGYDVIFL